MIYVAAGNLITNPAAVAGLSLVYDPSIIVMTLSFVYLIIPKLRNIHQVTTALAHKNTMRGGIVPGDAVGTVAVLPADRGVPHPVDHHVPR